MDFSKQKKDVLLGVCKVNGIKGYSKLNKEALIKKLADAGITSASIDDVPVIAKVTAVKEKKTAAKPKEAKPKLEKLVKKLEQFLSCDSLKKELGEFKADVADKSILDLVKGKCTDFITLSTLTPADYKRYVDDYGVVKSLVEFVKTTPKFNFATASEEKIYSTLAEYIYSHDTVIYDGLVKKCKKFILTLQKPDKVAKSLKPKIKEKKTPIDDVKEPEESESESESDDQNVVHGDDSEEEDDAEEDETED